MLCFDVMVNGKRLCRAGVKRAGVLSAIVSWVGGRPNAASKGGRTRRGETKLEVGGLYHVGRTRDVFPDWVSRRLMPGDEVTIRIVKAEGFDRPQREKVQTREWVEEEERAYYERMRRKYEGRAEETPPPGNAMKGKRGITSTRS
jgi:hypothetical protein